jgi:hypothetical protein
MKNSKLVVIVTLALALASPTLAQRSRVGSRNGSGPLIDPATVVVVDGTVQEFVAGLGQGMPSLVVADAAGSLSTFILGPFWYLSQEGFVAAPGDLVTVTAYACTVCETGMAVVTVVNTTQGVTLVLRDTNGLPLWTQQQAGAGASGQGGNGQGSQGGGSGNSGGNGNGEAGGRGRSGNSGNGGAGMGSCNHLVPDLARTTTLSGTVADFVAASGDGPASVTLTTSAGEVIVLLSPASVLVTAGFAPALGTALDVVAAPVEIDGTQVWIALTVTDVASGLTLVFRDPATGLPVTGTQRGRR